jgi:hypothetical protein
VGDGAAEFVMVAAVQLVLVAVSCRLVVVVVTAITR